jgi:hypothetical protein
MCDICYVHLTFLNHLPSLPLLPPNQQQNQIFLKFETMFWDPNAQFILQAPNKGERAPAVVHCAARCVQLRALCCVRTTSANKSRLCPSTYRSPPGSTYQILWQNLSPASGGFLPGSNIIMMTVGD